MPSPQGSKITCTRRIQFCAGHRVVGHEGKCRSVHGHNYVLLVTAEAPKLDNVGRVIDFSVLKNRLDAWVNTYWDHAMVHWQEDYLLNAIIAAESDGARAFEKVYSLPENPTAENMAKYLLEHICPVLFGDSDVTITKLVLWETENCYAEVTA